MYLFGVVFDPGTASLERVWDQRFSMTLPFSSLPTVRSSKGPSADGSCDSARS